MPPISKAALFLPPVEALPIGTRTATFDSAAIDLKNFDGEVSVLLHSKEGTGNADNTLTATIQECDTTGGTYLAVASGAIAFTVVTNAAGGQCAEVIIDTRLVKRFAKIHGVIAGTTPSFICGASYRGFKKYPTLP